MNQHFIVESTKIKKLKNKSKTIGRKIKEKANDEFWIMIIKSEGLIKPINKSNKY